MTMTSKYSQYFWLFFISALFYLLCGAYNTPLHPYNTSDMLIYKVMGEGWLHGAVPYRDLFDHKGPYVYFIQMLGLLIEGNKWGIYLLSTLNLSISLILFLKIGKLLNESIKSIYLAIAAVLALYFATMGAGDLTEEWSLPFQIYPLYLLVKNRDAIEKTRWYEAILFGMSCGVLALIRLNNLCPNCAFALVMAYFFVKEKLWGHLLKNTALCVVGIVLASAPFLIYFYANDALKQMFDITIIFNLEYNKIATPLYRIIHNLFRLLPILGILCYLSWKIEKKLSPIVMFFFCNAVMTFVVYYKSFGFQHYYMILMPSMFVLMLFLQKMYQIKRVLLIIALVFLPYSDSIWMTAKANLSNSLLSHFQVYKTSELRYTELQKMLSLIPVADRGNIYCYGIPNELAGIFLLSETYPCGKYFYNQNWFSKFSETVRHDVIQSFKDADVRYILVDNNNKNDAQIKNFLLQDCKLIYKSNLEKFQVELYKKERK